MVKFYQHTFTYEHPWPNVTYAFWLRYPNPFASHVMGVDVLDRYIDADGTLHTTRLILKRGVLPKWAPAGIIRGPESFIIEYSEVDPRTHTMITQTRNLDHTRVMQVVETQTFKLNPENKNLTSVKTEARIISRFGWGLTGRIEGFGFSKFSDNTLKARLGMAYVLERIREKSLLNPPVGFLD